ncbi:TPA: biotin/lipoyl-binding protein, partial [Neisseria meningitidis]
MATHGDEVKIQNRQEADSAKAKRKRCLTALTLLFALAAAAAGSAFFLWWQHEEETEDAYVAGRVVQVTPQKGGTVRKVLHDDTDAVKKGDVLAVLDDDNDVLAYERAKNEL